MQDRRSLEENLTRPPAEMPEQRKDELREFYQQFNPPIPGSFLSQPVQFAALPEDIADFFAAPADEDLDEAPQSFEDFLAAVPLAQAEDLAQAFMAPQMPQTFEGFLEDVPLEQANVLHQAYQAQNMPLPVRSPFEMPLPVKSPYSMPLPVKSPYSMPLPVKSPFSMPLPAKSPVSMALPARSPIDIQVANLANIGLPPADLEDIDAQAQVESLANIGLTPAEMAALEQAENFANIGLESVPQSNVAAFAVPALADVMAQEQAANLGACLSSHWSRDGESDSLPTYEQGFSPLEDRRRTASAALR